MASKEKESKKDETGQKTADEKATSAVRILTSVIEVANELTVSVHTLYSYLRKYPFEETGVSGHLNGRWHVPAEDVWRWYRYIKRQEIRHPDARRMRPEEPPEIKKIRAR